ncbi:porin [Rhodocytophaga aerolata]|uniref:Porin n=1 Tax=Rhodocytophaga aerolata TaxID=455078 RepID=A0ABT8R038_9BACT|nr:porin [Rhodocytophaga aerolata]MDO1444759.1 porin [Rhodocytophaga aerolata]
MKYLLTILFFSIGVPGIFAQTNDQDEASLLLHETDGINIASLDSTYQINFRFRMQNRFELGSDASGNINRKTFLVRRMRLRSFGYLGRKNLTYQFQLGFARGDADIENSGFYNVLRDAVIFYKPTRNLELGMGLTKLPGNRQRVISSGEQQFADRSLSNATFNLDRDAGVFVYYRNKFKGGVRYNLMGAISTGKGRNFDVSNAGLAYTGKVELLPFGDFTLRGDYFEGDWVREKSPKLSIAAAYSFNEDAVRAGGQIGEKLYGISDINTFISDILFKYSGFALYAEYIKRDASNPLTYNADNDLRYVYEGTGLNIQASYMLPVYLEFAARYTAITPDKELEVATTATRQYTLAATRYVRWHRVKLQTDLTYQDVLLKNDILNSKDGWLFRFQVEVGI